MTLRVGTDCSGIEAPIQALLQLNIPFEHVFASETDKFCVESIKANYKPRIIYGDITQRDAKNIPDIDLYVCGFPCQPFSQAGKGRGLDDKRGNVFMTCIDVIKTKKPKYFILENVKGLLSNNKGETWKILLEMLGTLEDYKISHKVLNTKDFGIPQNRERLFIIGIKSDCTFAWPTPHTILRPLSEFVEDGHPQNRACPYVQRCIDRTNPKAVFIDCSQTSSVYPNGDRWSPTVITTNKMWCKPHHRYATLTEKLRLQGFPVDFKQVVSDTQFGKQIGNSMSVNVLCAIIKNLGV